MSSPATAEITFPEHLPISAHREDIADLLRHHQVIVVAGETGSGKTTQLPKIALSLGLAENGMIGHTQPRRIAARSVAERIAEEIGEDIGGTVGYQVRFTSDVSEHTAVKVMTDGILLAEIQHDPQLSRYSVIIIDEAHERSLNIDFLLGYLKRLLPQRPDLKVIITSATIDVESFAEHFASPSTADAPGEPAPIIQVSGRTYPVEIRYRPLTDPHIPDDPYDDADDAEEARDPLDAVADAIEELAGEDPGDILVFFPGEREIRDASEVITERLRTLPARMRDAEVLPLYGRLTMAEQQRVFQPSGRRTRIVLATNVAETSLTVPGIKYVVDTGTARISRYSQRTKVQRLPIERISQASANQRSGRAGRTSSGIAIRLYSEEDFNARPEFTDPEILRTSLASVILHMLSTGVSKTASQVEDFPFLQPPEHRQITDGIKQLTELGALNTGQPVMLPRRKGPPVQRIFTKGTITPIGRKLAQLPIDPSLGRMILAAREHQAVKEVIVLAAALTIQDPRERPTEQRDAADTAHARFSDENSDFSGILNLWVHLRTQQQELSGNQFRKMCRAEFINYVRVREWQDLVRQLQQLAGQVGVHSSTEAVDPVGKHDAIHRSILTGLLGHIGSYDPQRRDYHGARGTRFKIFPGSALFKKKHDFVMAAELVETSQLWARQNARIEPEWIEAAAGDLAKHTVSDPVWSRRQGAAIATERVTVYGVTIVADRSIRYYRMDRARARQMFIQHALVEGDWNTRHRFVARNQRRLAEIEEMETRLRRHDLAPAPHVLYEFFDARIPAHVVSQRHFDAWWKKARHENQHLLDFDPDKLVSATPEELDPALYPTTFAHPTPTGEVELPLTYEFRPRTLTPDPQAPQGADAAPETDGVTVTIPIEILHHMEPWRFEWLIPGLRHELLTALIRGLPKPVRKNLVPAPDTATQILNYLQTDTPDAPQTMSFYGAVSDAVRTLKYQAIDPEMWAEVELPDHLVMTYRIVDSRRGAILGVGDDLQALKTRLAPQNQSALAASLQAAGFSPTDADGGKKPARSPKPAQKKAQKTAGPSIEPRTGLTSWDVGDLPESVHTSIAVGSGSQKVTGYPALAAHASGSGVGALSATPAADLVILRTAEEARLVHRGGVISLLHASLPPATSYLADHLNHREKLVFATGTEHKSVESLLQDVTRAAIDSLMDPSAALPRTQQEFSALAERIRAEVIDRCFEVTSLVESILSRAREVNQAIKKVRSLSMAPILADLRHQLDEQLLTPHVITATPFAQLSHYPRYLQAMSYRLEKLTAGGGKLQQDVSAMSIIHGLEEEYQKTFQTLTGSQPGALNDEPAVPIPEELTRIAGMLQELRVSFFAQELGTAVSVSEKKIRTALRQAASSAV